MKLQLTMRGGIYGTLELEPIDINDKNVNISKESLTVLEQEEVENYAVDTDQEHVWLDDKKTEHQIYEIRIITEDQGKKIYRYPESVIAVQPRLKALIDAIWKLSKPVS